MNELKRGNIVLLTKPLADLICIVQEVTEGSDVIRVRYLDSPPKESIEVKRSDVLKLAEEQERMLPRDFLDAVTKQREVVFAPKREKKVKKGDEEKAKTKRLEEVLRNVDMETLLKLMEGGEA